jgi:hypothetical protein
MEIISCSYFLPFLQQVCATGLSFRWDEEPPRCLYYSTLLFRNSSRGFDTKLKPQEEI